MMTTPTEAIEAVQKILPDDQVVDPGDVYENADSYFVGYDSRAYLEDGDFGAAVLDVPTAIVSKQTGRAELVSDLRPPGDLTRCT